MRLKPAQQYVTIPLSILGSGLIGKLSLVATKTYLVLLIRSDSNRNQCWPSIRSIAADANISTTSALKAISELEELGLIVKHKRTSENGDAASNLYTVMVPDVEPETRHTGVSTNDTPVSSNETPCINEWHTGVSTTDTELKPIELKPINNNTPTGSDVAEAPSTTPIETPKQQAKPDPYQAVLEVYSLANMQEPPRCEITPLLRSMKEAMASGWSTERIAAAWMKARTFANWSIWSLAYTLRHLTEAEAMHGSQIKHPQLSGEDRKAAARDAVKQAFGGKLNDH